MKTSNTLYIKNMVCPRCIKVVSEELEKLNVKVYSIDLGEVVTEKERNELPLTKISKILSENGFELIEDSNSKTIEAIKKEIISAIQQYEKIDLEKINFTKYLSDNIGKEYHQLSPLFSKIEGITIEHYIILQKIEKTKEFIKYNELTLSEIAYKLGYSSVQHLSRQFKNVTGMTASQFKLNINNLRKPIDSIK